MRTVSTPKSELAKKRHLPEAIEALRDQAESIQTGVQPRFVFIAVTHCCSSLLQIVPDVIYDTESVHLRM